jgi:TPR repeat protein
MTVRALVLPCLLAGLLAWPSAHAGHDEGMNAYSSGDYETAAREFKALAKAGDREAQYLLGLLYEEGQGVEKDEQEAAFWLARSADQGFADAYFALGQMFANRKGEHQDRMAAHHWFSLAKAYGHRLGEEELQRNLRAMTPEMAEMARNRLLERGTPGPR